MFPLSFLLSSFISPVVQRPERENWIPYARFHLWYSIFLGFNFIRKTLLLRKLTQQFCEDDF
jgi:hypothetical protein